MSTVAVSGYIGFNNFGDEAIFLALSGHLKSLGCKVVAICSHPEKVALTYNVETCFFKSIFGLIKTISKCDVLISGGGSLLQNKTSNYSLFYYLFVIFLAKILSKKVIIFSQGFEGINGRFCNLLAEKILQKVDFVSVRDKNSVEKFSQYNINADLTSDPIYSLLEKIKIEKEKNGLVVQLRSCATLTNEYIENLACAISKSKTTELKVFSFQKEYDREICTKFIEELKKYNINSEFIENATIEETFRIINSAKYLISTRLHGLIVANSLKTKAFALIYDDKVKTLCEEFNIENINLHNYTKNEFNDKVVKFLQSDDNNFIDYRKYDWSILNNYLAKSGVKID